MAKTPQYRYKDHPDSNSSVRYSDSFTSSEMREVSAHISSETGASFYGTWMLVAEWNNVSQGFGIHVSYRHCVNM